MTWHQVTSLFRSHPSAQALVGQRPALLKGADQDTGFPRGICTVQSRVRRLNCSSCSPKDRLCEGLDSGWSSHRWIPSAQHRGWHRLWKTSVVVCSLLLQDTKYLLGLPNFSGIQFTVDSYLGYCQLKPEFSPHVLLQRPSLLWTRAIDFSLD